MAFASVLLFDLLERRSFLEKDFGKNSRYLRPITNIDEPNVFHISYKLIRQRDDFYYICRKRKEQLEQRFLERAVYLKYRSDTQSYKQIAG